MNLANIINVTTENDIETNKKAIINLKKNIEKTKFIRFEEIAASYIIK